MEELDWPEQRPALSPIKHFWDELERHLRARPYCQTSESDLTDALMAELVQITAASFQNLVESHYRREEAVKVAD